MKWLKIFGIIMVMLLAGCNEISEPSDLAYVVAIGIDPAENENIYNITLQIANPIAISGGSNEEGGEGGKKTISAITVESPTIFSAVNVANHLNSKRISLAHTALIAICDEIAQKGLDDFADSLGRSGEIRQCTSITIIRGSAKEYLDEIKPTNEVNPVQYYKMIYSSDYTGYIPKMTSREFYMSTICPCKEMAVPISAVKEENDENSEIIYEGFEYLTENYIAGNVKAESEEKTQSYGMAIVSNGKMIAEATALDAEVYNMISGKYTQSEVSYRDKKSPDVPVMVLQSQQKRPKIKVKIVDGKPKISIKVFMEADLRTVSGAYLIEEDFNGFEEQAKAEIKRVIDEFLLKTIEEYKCDVVGFGEYAKRRFKTFEEFLDYDWQNRYLESEFETEVDFHMRRSGLVDRKQG